MAAASSGAAGVTETAVTALPFGRVAGGTDTLGQGRRHERVQVAVEYALAHKDDAPASGAIYGGVAGGMTDEADEFIRMVMADMMDVQQSVPPA